ncbi:hypothetical protein HKD37_15G043055 [Glycine soja]
MLMGTNQIGKRFYQVKIKGLDVTSLKELGRQAFRKAYGKILNLTIVEVFTEAVVSLTQYYDQPLRCFTFGDIQIVPTVEEFEEILGCPLGRRKLYHFSGFLPSLSKIAAVVGDSARELDRIKKTRNGVVGLPRKYLEGKARDMVNQEEWVPFADVLALLIFEVVLFPNVDGLVDLAAIDAFLAYHHSKESPVVAILTDLFDTFDRRCEKNNARIVCCLPALCVWLVSHLFQQDIRHPCPLQSYRSCVEKRRVDWDQYLAGIGGRTIYWFPRRKEGNEGVLFSCGDYPNIPLIGTKGCINYNPALAIRQLGYPMRGAPTVIDFGAQSFKIVQRVHKAWESPLRKDKELRGICNGIIGGYHEWMRVHTRGLDWLSKLKIINEENFEAPEEDEEVQALKTELGKARLAKEKFKLTSGKSVPSYEKKMRLPQEPLNKKPRGLARKSMAEINSEELYGAATMGSSFGERKETSHESKRSLAQHLKATEQSMLAIIGQYKEELNQSLIHEQKLVEDFAQAYTEKEARGRVIDALHQEATMWMDRFALTLNGSQDLPRLLAKAKAIAKLCSAPEEIHGLINYCQHMIDLMAHIIRNHRNATGFNQRYSPQAYPYGLPPDFTPRTAPDDLSQAPTFEGQLPPHADYPLQEDDEGDAHLGPLLPLKESAPHELPQPNIIRHAPSPSAPVKELVPFSKDKGKIDLFEERIESRLRKGKFEYASNAGSNNNRRALVVGTQKKEGDTHAPSLLQNHLVVAIPGKVFQSPYPKWYNSNATCAYHSGAPGHNIDSCLPFKYKVQYLINAGWLSFQEEGPNIKTNPLASHGGASVNAIEKDKPSGSKRLEDVATSRRFIYRSLQAACMVSRGGDKSDECLFHLGESHDMETCPAGQLEVSEGDREEPQICMQSTERKAPPTPKALVICFTRNVTGSRSEYPPTPRECHVVDIRGNPYKYGLGYEHGKPGRKNAPSRLRADRAWPGHVSQCFTSVGIIGGGNRRRGSIRSAEFRATVPSQFPSGELACDEPVGSLYR